MSRSPLQNCSLDAATALQRRGAPFFYTASLSLPQLCDPTFVEAQLGDAAGDATGRVYAVTAASPLDGERDAAALLPNGALAPLFRHDFFYFSVAI